MIIKKVPVTHKKLNLKMSELIVGAVFYADSPAGGDRGVFLKAFDVVVSLDDPSDTWESKGTLFENVVFLNAELHVSERV